MLKSPELVGAVVYYDGMHNDARMNLALILTAIKHGAVVTNYTEVTSLQKDTAGKLVGAVVKHTLTGADFPVCAKSTTNATGPITDALLTLDDPSHKPIVQASSVHVTFPDYSSPRNGACSTRPHRTDASYFSCPGKGTRLPARLIQRRAWRWIRSYTRTSTVFWKRSGATFHPTFTSAVGTC